MKKLDKILSNQLRRAFISALYSGSRAPLDDFKSRTNLIAERALKRHTNVIHESEMMLSRNTCPSFQRERENLLKQNGGSPSSLNAKIKDLETSHATHLSRRVKFSTKNRKLVDRIQQAGHLTDSLETRKESFTPFNNLANISAKTLGASIGIGIASLVITSFAPPLTQIFTVASVVIPLQLVAYAYQNNKDYKKRETKGIKSIEGLFPPKKKLRQRVFEFTMKQLKLS